MMVTVVQRRLPIGAEVSVEGVHFRVWAPRRKQVEVIIEEERAVKLTSEGKGYFSGIDARAKAGALYQFRLDATPCLVPDPVSRFQPRGPHGPSEIVDSSKFSWTDTGWHGISIKGQILYEMHIGTFTREGTWKAASRYLPDLAELGITALEVMPVASFPGQFGWGYDGVDLFAPTALYGTADEFRQFVDRAHASGLAVILDVVYNHLGPDGNYLKEFSDSYFTNRYINEWGEPINFDGPLSGPVREFFISNARYWIDEFHLDGLRLDATQQMFDTSHNHIIKDIVSAARDAAQNRDIIVIAENEPQWATMARPSTENGFGVDSLWNDDFHHTARVAASGRCEAYYSGYRGTPQEFISSVKWGFLYQGQYYHWQHKRRGVPTQGLRPEAFVNFIQNHDQVANSFSGMRLHQFATPALYRALTALLMLAPQTPLLFQGQEFGASAPFLYFADHNAGLALLVQEGRETFLQQFPSIKGCKARIAEASDRRTFEKCKLDHTERTVNDKFVRLHRDLIHIRKTDPVFLQQRTDWLYGAVLGRQAFALRFFGGDAGDRLILVNLGRDLDLSPAPEPLLAEPADAKWCLLWSSESPFYGGCGREPVDERGLWTLTGQSALVLSSVPDGSRDV
jgi:maltooligosyltrehalose trehalohydrolase